MAALKFTISHTSRSCNARLGRVATAHGEFDTPAFMPVGTKATVKGMLPELVAEAGSQIILANTYHLMLRPGSDLVAEIGGLHRFMQWPGPILTDSGGFQVFSLTDINTLDDDGVTFRSHLDGSEQRLTPERSMRVQNELGADIIMAFDDCPPGQSAVDSPPDPSEPGRPRPGPGTAGVAGLSADDYNARNQLAARRTQRWLERCADAHGRPDDQALFGIVQGGVDLELRSWCAKQVIGVDVPGYAIGGVAVGEPPDVLHKVVNHTAPLLPDAKPRYLMGVGYERDILAAVRAGVDMFDCVLPTRNGRTANAFTRTGQIRLRNAQFARDERPIDPACACTVCRRFSRAYLRHLFLADEMLGPILTALHNIAHFQALLLDIRAAIRDDGWSLLKDRWPALG